MPTNQRWPTAASNDIEAVTIKGVSCTQEVEVTVVQALGACLAVLAAEVVVMGEEVEAEVVEMVEGVVEVAVGAAAEDARYVAGSAVQCWTMGSHGR